MEACTRSRSRRRLTRAARGQAYLALSQTLARPSRFQLLERPFQKNGTKVAERALLAIGELQQFVSEMRPDSHRHTCLPYAHGQPLLTVRRPRKQTKQCFICFASFALVPLCRRRFCCRLCSRIIPRKRPSREHHDGWPLCVPKIWRERYDNSKKGSGGERGENGRMRLRKDRRAGWC